MKKEVIDQIVRRSNLIMPVNRRAFIEKAWTRNADAVTLDFEDGVAFGEKAAARECLAEMVPLVARGGSEVIVRVNSEPELLYDDLKAAVIPGVNCITIPKVETAEEVVAIEEYITKLEAEQGIAPQSIQTMVAVESAKGYINMNEIAAAGTRTTALSLGTEDLTKELGIEIIEGDEILFAKMQLIMVACANGLQPRGLMGSMANFKDLDRFKRDAIASYHRGFRSSSCIHPSQVEILNEALRPSDAEVSWARRVVEALEEATAQGLAAVKLDGKMIDKPVAQRAQKVLDRVAAIEKKEAYKLACRKKLEETLA